MNESISILDSQTELNPIPRNALRGLNADTLLRFSFYTTVFNGQSLCLIRQKNKEESIPPMQYKRVTEQIEAVVGVPVAILLDEPLIYIQRERLINQGVYFIISNKYAFLPSLIVNAQLKKRKKANKLTSASQYLLLYYLSDEKASDRFTIKDIENVVPYNYVTMARAVTNLEDCGLCETEIDSTRTKHIYFTSSKRELWEKSQKYLSSPVKRVLYADVIPKGHFSISGVNALSHYSHLNPEQHETLAIWDKHFESANGQYNEIEGLCKTEVWKYPTSMPNQENYKVVDKLSLYLSMQNDSDPRIEKELEIMIDEMKW
jgi:DNA-binding MarR family transcriptional regulator